jgi:hypothetical protein
MSARRHFRSRVTPRFHPPGASDARFTREDEFGCRTLVVFKGAGFDFSFLPHSGSGFAPAHGHDCFSPGLSAAEGFFVGGADWLVGAAAAEEAGLGGEVSGADVGGGFLDGGFGFGDLLGVARGFLALVVL